MKGQRFLGMTLACLFFLPTMALAQVTASAVGTVQDTSGAVIPGAAVTVKNVETGVARTATTDDRGSYRALSLPVGRYEITVEKTGFKRGVRTGINLVVGQEAVVNLSLEVGEVQQAVTVTGEAPIVNTTTAATSGLVGEQQVKDLPLNGRSFDNLVTLNPGTSNPTSLRTANGGKPPGNYFNIAGRRSEENMFLLNGIEYTGASLLGSTPGGASGQLLGIDAVREFNVQANTYDAQYGKRSGGHINVVTMSGTNQFHGSAFEFLRNDKFDAPSFFDNQAHAIIGSPKPAFRRNDFGASAGGPIRKDNTFIFGNYEGYRQSLTTTNVSFVPNNASRAAAAPGMVPYLALYPIANGPTLGGGIAEAFVPAVNPVREDFGTVRLDHVFSEKDGLSGVYTIDDGSNITPGANPFSGGTVFLRSQVLSLDETHTFSPSIINTARVGFSRAAFFQDNGPLIPLPASLSLIAGDPMGQVSVGSSSGVQGAALSVFGSIAADQIIHRNLFTYTDSVQIVKGKHLLNLGAWFQRVQVNDLFIASAYGSVTFPDLPSFLQGKASTFTGVSQVGGNGFHYSRQWEGAWYAEDTIKVSSNLTLNLGLRHEFTNGWNVNPLGPVNFLFDANNVIQTQPLISNQMLTANHAKRLMAPRIGVAWDPFGHGKTVIHAGFGTYYSLLDDFTDVIPQASAFTVNNVQFPFQYVPGTPIPAGGAPRSFAVVPSDPKTPTIQEWSFLIEQQITASTALSVGYIGSHGVHLLGSGEWNPPRYVFCPASPCPASIPAGTKYYPPQPNPRLNPNRATTTDYTAFVNTSYNSLQIDLRQRLSKGLTFRANYSFSKALDDASTQLSGFFSNCSSTAMDVTNLLRDYGPSCYDIQQRFAFSGSYELPIGSGKTLLGGLSGAANKLLGGWRMNAIVSAQTGFPFTPVIGFGNSRDLGTGGAERPDQFPARSNSSIVSGVTAGCQGLAAGQQLGTSNRWFDPCAFFLPPAGTYGALGRNTLRGPRLSELDVSFFKDTRITERTNLEFRAEGFNILNHANFSPPNTTVFTSSGSVSGSAGVISGLATTSRQIQFGLKLIW